jgi:hypothetical protein
MQKVFFTLGPFPLNFTTVYLPIKFYGTSQVFNLEYIILFTHISHCIADAWSKIKAKIKATCCITSYKML